MLIVALVLAVIGLAALVTAVVTSNEVIAWVCIAASVLGVILLIIDAIRERQSRDLVTADTDGVEAGTAAAAVGTGAGHTVDETYQTFDEDYPDEVADAAESRVVDTPVVDEAVVDEAVVVDRDVDLVADVDPVETVVAAPAETVVDAPVETAVDASADTMVVDTDSATEVHYVSADEASSDIEVHYVSAEEPDTVIEYVTDTDDVTEDDARR